MMIQEILGMNILTNVFNELIDLWCSLYENWKAYNVVYFKTYVEPFFNFCMRSEKHDKSEA